MAGLAEFESSLISERVKAGMERAKAEGKRYVTDVLGFDLDNIIDLRDATLAKLVAAQRGAGDA